MIRQPQQRDPAQYVQATAMNLDEETTSHAASFARVRTELAVHKSLLWQAGCCGSVLAVVVSFLVPNQYRSNAKLMPPEQQALSTVSALSPLTGQLPAVAAGGLLNTKTPGAVSVGILGSRTVQDEIINRFDLRRVYHRKLYESTRDILTRNTHIEEDRKNGIIDIEVTDRDPGRARKIARAYIEDLNRLLNQLSSSSARKEREFIEGRLTAVKQSLDVDTRVLSQFSSRNATLDYQKQGEATFEVASKLEGELISAESELSALEAVYTEDNVQVRTLQARISQLRAQLGRIAGNGQSSNGALSEGELFPSIRQLPLLGATYAELMRQVSADEAIYAQLQRQYELARVQEAKEIPAVRVLDEPDFPEKKAFPPRALFTVLGALGGVLAATGWVAVRVLRRARFGLIYATPAPAGVHVATGHSG